MINLWFFFLFLAAQTFDVCVASAQMSTSQPDNLYSAMVREGDPAPFTGIIFTPEAATKILVDHRAQLDQLAADLEYKHKVEMAEMQLKLDQTKILLDTEKEKNNLLASENRQMLEMLEGNQQYRIITPILAATAAITSITVAAILLFTMQ